MLNARSLSGLLLGVMALSSCSIFASDKELPKGQRVSVLSRNGVAEIINGEIKSSQLPAPTTNARWVQNGVNEMHTGGNFSVNSDLNESWSAKFGKGSSKRNLLLAAPIAYDGTVFAQDVNGTVSAFELKDGAKLWKQKLKPQTLNENDNGLNGAGLTADDKAVYALGGFGSVFALDKASGKILWRTDLNTPLRTAPTVCGQKLLVQSLDNRLFALDVQSGKEVWKYNISAEDTVLAGNAAPSCSVAENLIVVGFSNGEIQAFSADIGYPAWNVPVIDNSQINLSTGINSIKASPIIDGQDVYAIGHNDLLTKVDYRTGEVKWSRKIGGTNLPWLSGNYLFVITNNNELVALNKDNGKLIWSLSLLSEYPLKERSDIYLSGPIMAGSELLVTASNGVLYKISPTNGAVLSRKELDENTPLSPIVADGYLIFATEEAELKAYK